MYSYNPELHTERRQLRFHNKEIEIKEILERICFRCTCIANGLKDNAFCVHSLNKSIVCSGNYLNKSCRIVWYIVGQKVIDGTGKRKIRFVYFFYYVHANTAIIVIFCITVYVICSKFLILEDLFVEIKI